MSWDDYRRTCMHGVREELDWHDCDQCKEIAEAMGRVWEDHRITWLFTKDPRNPGVTLVRRKDPG